MAAGNLDPPGARLSLRLVLSFYGVMAGVAVAWRLAVDGVLPWLAAPGAAVAPLGARLAAGLGAGLVLVWVSRELTERTAAGRALSDALARLVGPVGPVRAWLLAGVSGLAEELLFRGALQPRVGGLAATLLFAAAHFVPLPGLRSWAAFALAAGAVFGALFALTGDLLAPFLAHAVVNGLNLAWLGRRRS
jgi:hypothetical protein